MFNFLKGHVAIAIDNKSLIHSNIYDMCVKIDNIKTVMRRIKRTSGNITNIKKFVFKKDNNKFKIMNYFQNFPF